jgi:hypothetical protein
MVIPDDKTGIIEASQAEVDSITKSITKVQLQTVSDTTRSLTFGPRLTKNFQKL